MRIEVEHRPDLATVTWPEPAVSRTKRPQTPPRPPPPGGAGAVGVGRIASPVRVRGI